MKTLTTTLALIFLAGCQDDGRFHPLTVTNCVNGAQYIEHVLCWADEKGAIHPPRDYVPMDSYFTIYYKTFHPEYCAGKTLPKGVTLPGAASQTPAPTFQIVPAPADTDDPTA
jgi:hypothetical protein